MQICQDWHKIYKITCSKMINYEFTNIVEDLFMKARALRYSESALGRSCSENRCETIACKIETRWICRRSVVTSDCATHWKQIRQSFTILLVNWLIKCPFTILQPLDILYSQLSKHFSQSVSISRCCLQNRTLSVIFINAFINMVDFVSIFQWLLCAFYGNR